MDNIEKKKREKEFLEFLLHSSIPQMKTGMWTTLILFILFRLITLLFFGDTGPNHYFLRFGGILPFIIATLLVLYIRPLHKWLRIILTSITFLSALPVFFIGATSNINEPGYQYYPFWVMLVIMGTFVFYRIRIRDSHFLGGLLVLSFILANTFNNSVRDEPMIFTIHLFFIVAITILGFFISGYRYHANFTIFLQKKELDQKNENLQKEIRQKEILSREIHHRVKNNLAIVIGLLDMQVRNNPNPEFKKLAREIEYRIRSMALIHEHLYKSDELDKLPLNTYLVAITNGIMRAFSHGNIRITHDIEPVDACIEIAMPLGIIVNEIVTNACKYAFPDQKQGEIYVSLKQDESAINMYRIMIKDNGIGIPDEISTEDQRNMGMFIIKLLSEQISARLTVENHNGTTFNLWFKGIRSNN